MTPDAPRPDLDEAERWVRHDAHGGYPPAHPKYLRTVLAEYDRRGAALADAQAEIARLRPYLDKAQAHTCPAPEWYPKVRDLLGDVVLAAAFARTDLAELPGHVAELRERALAAAPAPAEEEGLDEREPQALPPAGTPGAHFPTSPQSAGYGDESSTEAPAPPVDEQTARTAGEYFTNCIIYGGDSPDEAIRSMRYVFGFGPAAAPAPAEDEGPPICGELGSLHGPGHPCVLPPGHELHRDGVGGEWTHPPAHWGPAPRPTAPAPAALHRGECYRACGCDDTAPAPAELRADCGQPDHEWTPCSDCPRSPNEPCACTGDPCCRRERDEQATAAAPAPAEDECGAGHDPERICCAHAQDVERLRVDRELHQDRADRLAVELMRLRDQIGEVIAADRRFENAPAPAEDEEA